MKKYDELLLELEKEAIEKNLPVATILHKIRYFMQKVPEEIRISGRVELGSDGIYRIIDDNPKNSRGIMYPRDPDQLLNSVLLDDADRNFLGKIAGKLSVVPGSGTVAPRVFLRLPKHAAKKFGVKPCGINLARFLVSCPPGLVVDHKDGNTLNNKRNNLRVCTVRENNRNARKRQGTKNKFKGVRKVGEKFRAEIKVQGKTKSLGTYSCEKTAARIYDKAAENYFGEFARTNKYLGLLE